ncbi:MAG TPA: zinc ribbon domain-containing protein [Ktedonobacterales bacterium]|nr:zinc ribbon domain-containing protein [Ktedonobacterales bacterium]
MPVWSPPTETCCCTAHGHARRQTPKRHAQLRNSGYKAERLGIRVEQVAPASTSQTCPTCLAKNKADDRRYVGGECGGMGHRDAVGAINIARDTGRHGHSAGATVA